MVIIGIDVDDRFFKVTADELGFTEEDVLEEEDSETVPKVDATVVEVVSTVVEVVATVFEVVATVVELVTTVVKVVDERTTVRVTVLKMTIDPRSRKSICSKMTSQSVFTKLVNSGAKLHELLSAKQCKIIFRLSCIAAASVLSFDHVKYLGLN